MIARLPGTRNAAPTPCTARLTASTATVGAAAHAIEASVNAIRPAM